MLAGPRSMPVSPALDESQASQSFGVLPPNVTFASDTAPPWLTIPPPERPAELSLIVVCRRVSAPEFEDPATHEPGAVLDPVRAHAAQ